MIYCDSFIYKNTKRKDISMKNFKKQTVRVLALLLVTATLLLALASCGKNISKVDVLRTEHFTVTAAMVTYSLYDTYHYYINYFGEEMLQMYFGIDTSVSLKKQYSDAERTKTWFDVFKTEAIDGFCNALALCEAAVADGVELSEIDKKFIQSEIDEIENLAAKDGMTLKEYIKAIYGKGVTEDDIRKSLELFRLANKKRNKDYSEVKVTESDIKDVIEKEGDTYLGRDILYFELTFANENEKTEKIKAYAQTMKAATTEEEFRKLAEDFVKTDYCVNTDSNKKVKKESIKNTTKEDDKTDVDRWFFASGTTVGSTYVYEGKASCVVYMAITEATKDETPTKNMYTIVFEPSVYGTLNDCKAKAEEIYARWKESGESLESFKALAKEYTTDYVSVYSGGYYPNIKQDAMVDELDKWLFKEGLEEGAHEIIKTDYGYHFVLYAGEGEPSWKADMIEGIKEDKNSVQILNYVELYKVTAVEGNMKYVKGH